MWLQDQCPDGANRRPTEHEDIRGALLPGCHREAHQRHLRVTHVAHHYLFSWCVQGCHFNTFLGILRILRVNKLSCQQRIHLQNAHIGVDTGLFRSRPKTIFYFIQIMLVTCEK